jgi:putative transcriptional regulator
MATESLAPVLLVSMPQMLDPNFSKTVVLLAEYGAHGAFGLVLNRRMDEPARAIVTADEPLDIHPGMYLFTGGPVEPTRAWILTADATLDAEALEVMSGVYLSASPALVRRTLESEPDPVTRMVVGYAGWGAGQLDIGPDLRRECGFHVGGRHSPPGRRTVDAARLVGCPLTRRSRWHEVPGTGRC